MNFCYSVVTENLIINKKILLADLRNLHFILILYFTIHTIVLKSYNT